MWTSFWKYIFCKTPALIKKKWWHLLIKKYRHTGKTGLTTQERSLTEEPFEESVTENSKSNLSLRTIKRTLSSGNLKKTLSLRNKENPITVDPQEFKDTQWLAPLKTLFDFLVIVWDRVGDRENFSHKNFGLGRPRFNATVT